VSTTERRARTWLRLDAAYCAGAGVLALALARPLSSLLHVPAAALVAIGLATVVWAALLAALARLAEWRQPLRLVAAFTPTDAGRLLLAAVAVEVAAFAGVQLRLLGRR
jgi:hypothetical protein